MYKFIHFTIILAISLVKSADGMKWVSCTGNDLNNMMSSILFVCHQQYISKPRLYLLIYTACTGTCNIHVPTLLSTPFQLLKIGGSNPHPPFHLLHHRYALTRMHACICNIHVNVKFIVNLLFYLDMMKYAIQMKTSFHQRYT